MKVYTHPRDEEWFRLGDITLCQDCNHAIQLRREPFGTRAMVDVWVHLGPSIAGHFAEPVVSLWEGAERRQPMERA